MFLKSIEVNGFKSFHNKKEIIINRGITGVVGPNGSGKSNIADALRWVLGEQSSKNLRGSSMQDVIFNGTQSRNQKGYCEVCLLFDNSDRKIDTDFTEISVRRKMYRSGESEYYINNASCRMKDILELFHDTGIGKEGYSIIGQGKIDEILQSKATQRRKVFEEAAGIVKYRVRKEEAERNLQKTNENITRIDDIILELQTQIDPLEKQMNEAKSYMHLRERLKSLEVNMFLYQFDKAEERIAKIRNQIKEAEQEYKDAETELEKMASIAAELRAQELELRQEIEAHNAKLSEYASTQEKHRGVLNLIEEKERNHKSTLDENEKKVQDSQSSIENNKDILAKLKQQINEKNTEIDKVYEHILEQKKKIESISSAEGALSLEEHKAQAEAGRVQLQTLDVRRSEAQTRLDMIRVREKEAQEQLLSKGEAAKDMFGNLEELERQVQEQAMRITQCRHQFNEVTQKIVSLGQQKEKKSDELVVAEKKYTDQSSRLKLLRDMREGYEGYFDSVRALFREAQKEPVLMEKIVGVLAEIIDVPKEYEVPLEVILGNALQNIVVRTDEDAKEIIEYLRRYNLGRATFLPSKSLKVRYLEGKERDCLSMEGVLCVASEAISCSSEVRPAVDFLLARTVIVKDMDCAIKVMRKTGYAFRVVTMQGDFIKPGGVITGGSLKNSKSGLLAQKRMVEELETGIVESKKIREELQTFMKKLEDSLAEEKVNRNKLLDEIRACEIATAEGKQKLDGAQKQSAEQKSALDELQKSVGEMHKEAEALEEELSRLLVQKEQSQTVQDEVLRKLQAIEQDAAERVCQTMEVKDELSKLEVAQNELRNQKNNLLIETQRLRDMDLQSEEGIFLIDAQTETIRQELQKLQRQKQQIKQELDDIAVEIKNAGAMVQDQFLLRDKLQNQAEELEEKKEEIIKQKNGLIEKKYALVAAKEKAELAKEGLQTKMWDDYGLTYNNALELKEEFAYQSAFREIDTIKRQLREMGAVNPNAIEDYARVRERYDDLVVQREDLVNAGEDLQIVIDGLLVKMRKSFKERFSLINQNFKKVFKELFGGGHAHLELLDDGDIIECGIEIIAEPPGKKLQSITLLSGGEKALTAIALLFAMLSINPSPICLLDEIDAPLDDANVVRLSEYLQKLSSALQFIVITHRKPTMAICNTLYGIAMQEKGVSDIVSVKLN